MKKQYFFKFIVCSMALCTALSLVGCGSSNTQGTQNLSSDVSGTAESSFEESGTQSTQNSLSDVDGTAESSFEESGTQGTQNSSSDVGGTAESSSEESGKSDYEVPEYTLGKIIASGSCGDNVKWELDEYNLLVISGSGKMEDYSYDSIKNDCDAPWNRIKEKVKTVIVKKGVTNIGDGAFAGCDNLTNITIPDDLTSIGMDGFSSTGLRNITIPNSVTSIGNGAFFSCTNLKSITIPESVTSIGNYAFGSCTKLASITVDKNNKYYSSHDGVLFDKDSATLICCPAAITGAYTVPASVTNIGDGAFYDCMKLTSITIPASVTNIGDDTFYGCVNLTSVTIPESVISIGVAAFYNCMNLTSITIPESVISIGKFAFYYCTSLTSIIIPANVKTIGDFAFYKWTSSQTIYIKGRSETPSGWSDSWRWECNANIVWNA